MNTELKLVKKEEETNVVPFATPKPAGKGPTGDNWLARLKEGCVFVTRMLPFAGMPRSIALPQYHVVRHTKKCTILFENLNDERFILVDTQEFSTAFELVEILKEE